MFVLCAFISQAQTYRSIEARDSIYLYPNDSFKIDQSGSDISSISFDKNWIFAEGKDKGINVEVCSSWKDGVQVDLPHRIERPNTALWYRKEIRLETPGFLEIVGDDGVQLYVNKRRVLSSDGNWFKVEAKASVELSIRVLNNAMAGGLRSVRFFSNEDRKRLQAQIDSRARQERLFRQYVLFNDRCQLEALAIDSVNVETSLNTIEIRLRDFPFIYGPILQQRDDYQLLSASLDQMDTLELWTGRSTTQLKKERTLLCKRCIFEIRIHPDSTYFYKMKVRNSETKTFKVAPADKNKFAFNVWGDSQSGWRAFTDNVSNMAINECTFSIGAGDLVANGKDESQWNKFLAILSRVGAEHPQYLVPGNHDYDGYYDQLVPENYLSTFGRYPTYFDWSYENCHFIAIDPNEQFPIGFSEKQRKWFHDVLESKAWKSATWRFVISHQPPFSQGWFGYQGDEVVRELLEPFFLESKIDFVIAGHTHDYERLSKMYGQQKVTFFITGGGGGGLESAASSEEPKMDKVIKTHHFLRFSVTDDSIDIEMFDRKMELRDSYYQTK